MSYEGKVTLKSQEFDLLVPSVFFHFNEFFNFRLLSSFNAPIPRLNHCCRLIIGKSK